MTKQEMIEATKQAVVLYAAIKDSNITINKSNTYWRTKGNTVYYMTTCLAELVADELIAWPWNYPGLS